MDDSPRDDDNDRDGERVRLVDPPHPAVIDPDALMGECDIMQLRRGGPGGQHRNKVSTAIRLRHRVTGIEAEANESREQSRNRKEALQRLRLRLAVRLRTRTAADETQAAPEHSAVRARRRGNLKISPGNDDYPAVIALLLDDLHRVEGRASETAELWKVSTTAVVSLLARHPPALQEVNRLRRHRGLKPLRPRGA